MKDVLTEALDIEGLAEVLRGIEQGRIRCLAVDTPVPSQFSHEILNANPYAFLDDAPLEERRARAVELRRSLPASVLEEAGQLDPAAIARVCEESRPDVRDAFAKAGVVVLKGDWTRRDPEITRYLTAQGAAGVPLYMWYPASGGAPRQLPQVLTPGSLTALK